MIIFLVINFHCIYISRSQGNLWEWILRIWYNDRRKIKLDQAEFMDMDPLSEILHLLMQCGESERTLSVWLAG